MKQNSCSLNLSSFAETVQLVENFVRAEIAQETIKKQLCYHTIAHAESVKRRANLIFANIKPILVTEYSVDELGRLKSLIDLSAIAHDMVQEFRVDSQPSCYPRQRLVPKSEIATANKLIEYIGSINQKLAINHNPTILFSQKDIKILEDAILATICERDPQAGKASYSFSPYSIYQPYLYNSQPKVSIVGKIIALADLGTLAIDGVQSYIQDGILIFLEDNLDLKSLIYNWENQSSLELPATKREETKTRLLNMTEFMTNLAQERYARLDLELAGFTSPIRQILKEKVLIHLNRENITQLSSKMPTGKNIALSELISFFHFYLTSSQQEISSM